MTYSTDQEKQDFIAELAKGANDLSQHGKRRRPMLVLDMDGNILTAYDTADGQALELTAEDDKDLQNISLTADIRELLKDGAIVEKIKAAKPLDVRLPEQLKDLLNTRVRQADHFRGPNPVKNWFVPGDFDHRLFDVCILTSRSMEDALKILKASGVVHPERLTLVADSGASLFLNGKQHSVIDITRQEMNFLKGVPPLREAMEKAVNEVLEDLKENIAGRPKLIFEEKGVATNVHWRSIFKHYGQEEKGAIDNAVMKKLHTLLQKYVDEKSPKDRDGVPTFIVKGGPATVEVIPGRITKGVGLDAIVKAAKDKGYTPSALVYAGDDICKTPEGNVELGTDYEAFMEGAKIAEKYGIPTFKTIHTHHPEGDQLNGQTPEPGKDAALAGIRPDIITRIPSETAQMVQDIVRAVVEARYGFVSAAAQTGRG